jgi:hypothetical protein
MMLHGAVHAAAFDVVDALVDMQPLRSNSVRVHVHDQGHALDGGHARPAGKVIQSWAWTTSKVSPRAISAASAA